MLIFRINLSILALSNILSSTVSGEEKLDNRLSFDLPRGFLLRYTEEHLRLTSKNTANVSTNDSVFNIHFRYSIHDYRVVITDSNDGYELYKVMCNQYHKCRILQDGLELIRLNGSIIRTFPFETMDSRQSIDIGNNWTMLVVPDEHKVMLFHADYSNQQALVELASFNIFDTYSISPSYKINIVQQHFFKPAFLIAMSIIVDGVA